MTKRNLKKQSSPVQIPLISKPVTSMKEYESKKKLYLIVMAASIVLAVVLGALSMNTSALTVPASIFGLLAFAIYFFMGPIILLGRTFSPVACKKCGRFMTVNPEKYEILEEEFEVTCEDGEIHDTRRDVAYVETTAKGNGVYESEIKTKQEGSLYESDGKYQLKAKAKVKWHCPDCGEAKIVDIQSYTIVRNEGMTCDENFVQECNSVDLLTACDMLGVDFGGPNFGIGAYAAKIDDRLKDMSKEDKEYYEKHKKSIGLYSYKLLIDELKNLRFKKK